MKKIKTMRAYIQAAPKEVQPILRKVRDTIQTAVPEAVPVMSYNMPAFKYNKRIIAYFAAWKAHVGFYPPAPKKLKRETQKYAGPKGNLQFPLNKPIPYALIKKIVKLRMNEINKSFISKRKK